MTDKVTNEYQNPDCILRGETVTIYSDSQATLKALNSVHVKSRLVSETVEALNNLTAKLGTQVLLRWVKGHAGIFGNVAADEAAGEAGGLVAAEADSPDPPKAMLHSEVDTAATRMWCYLWDNTLGHRQTRDWFPDGPDPKFAFDVIRLPKLICSQVVAFVTGHCYLNRHQALIDNTFRESIRRHVGNEDRNGEEIIPPADPSCTLCKETGKEETPLHLMTECAKLAQLRLDTFGTHEPRPPFRFPVYKIVSFLKQAKIPSFPMQPFLEELFPAAPTGISELTDPQPQAQAPTQQQQQQPNQYRQQHPLLPQPQAQHLPSDTPRHSLSPSTSGTGREGSLSPIRNEPPPPSAHPEGDRWFQRYLYTSNSPPNPHREKETSHTRPFRY